MSDISLHKLDNVYLIFFAWDQATISPVAAESIAQVVADYQRGEATKAHRHTGNVIYHVAKGSGHSVINGTKFAWAEKDIFCVPAWMWHEHANGSASDDACLFSFNDFPVMEKLGFYREEAYGENGGHQQVTGTA